MIGYGDTSAPRPHAGANERYCDDLVLALRMKDVPGDRIGAVLAEVRDHLGSGGEDPVEAFGSARDYADAVTAEEPPRSWSTRIPEWARNTVGVAGLFWALEGGASLLSGRQGTLTELQLVLPAVLAVTAALLVAAVGARRRIFVLAGVLANTAVVSLVVALTWASPFISLPVPAAALLVPGVLVVAVTVVAVVRTADPVLDPLQDPVGTRRRRHVDGGVPLTLLLMLLLLVPVLLTTAGPVG